MRASGFRLTTRRIHWNKTQSQLHVIMAYKILLYIYIVRLQLYITMFFYISVVLEALDKHMCVYARCMR